MEIAPTASLTVRILTVGWIESFRWPAVCSLSAPFWRCYWNAEPSACLIWQGSEIELGPDRLVIVAPHTEYRRRCRQPMQHLWVHATAAPPFAACSPGLHTAPAPAETITLLRKGDGTPRLAAAAALFWCGLAAMPAERLAAPVADPRIARCLALLADGPARPDLIRLAAIADMHPRSLLRRFRQVVGTTPGEWLRHRRLDAAAADLLAGDPDIEAIAKRHAFTDRHHLTRWFVRRFGHGPASWRQLMNTGN